MRFAEYLRGLTRGMRMRLFLHAALLVLLLCAVALGTITLFGRLSIAERQTAETLTAQLLVYEQDVTDYFDNVAARGIHMSEELSEKLGGYLRDKGLVLTDLDGSPAAIADAEDSLYATLAYWLTTTDCSGAYYFLNATANPSLANAGRSRCGMYIKVANVNVYRPVDPKLVLFRGNTDVGSGHGLEFHNMWALELNTDMFPGYALLTEKANKDLNTCFLFTDAQKLPGTWERAMLLCVPIVGRDGAVYGVCGFEISQIYFKLRLAQSGAVPHMTSLLASHDGGAFDADTGFESGDRTGHYKEITGRMTSSLARRFSIFTSAEGSFVGMETSVGLSPLENERRVAVMIPKEDYDSLQGANTRENLVICLLLLLTAVFGSVFMSRSYLRPVLRGLEQIKQGGTGDWTPVNVPEIDDLMDFLAEKDREHEAALSTMERKLTRPDTETKEEPYILPSREAYAEFLKNLATLTRTEREVFDLYRQGHRAKDMPKLLYRSANTIKTHNKNIYGKLCVFSREELLGYIKMMDEERGDNG